MKWLKMDCDAQENLDMRKLVSEWGWDWYGRYWAILGKIGMLVTDKCQTFALHTNNGQPFPVKLLADDLGTTVERLTTFCDYLADNHLIDPKAWKSENLIYAPKLRERADEYTAKLLTKSRQTPDIVPTKKKIRRRLDTEEEKKIKARPKSIEEVRAYFLEQQAVDDSVGWWDHFEGNGWKVGKALAPMADWRATVRTWIRNSGKWGINGSHHGGDGSGRGKERRTLTQQDGLDSLVPPASTAH